MSQTLQRIRELVAHREVRVSEHGYDELADEDIFLEEIVAGIAQAAVVEDYPTYHKGPCVLVLQRDERGLPIHVLWGIPKNTSSPAVVVTAYRPAPERWSDDLMRRKP
jgi:hypothetical protein